MHFAHDVLQRDECLNNVTYVVTHCSPCIVRPSALQQEKLSFGWCNYLFTVSSSGLLFQSRCRNPFFQFHFHRQQKNDLCNLEL